MAAALTLLLLCQLAGETLARLLGLPVPGPVIGMLLLFLGLQWRSARRPAAAPADDLPLGKVAGLLLAHLSLLFVPAGAGIIRYAGSLLASGRGVVAALVISTALTLVVTAFVFSKVAALTDLPREDGP